MCTSHQSPMGVHIHTCMVQNHAPSANAPDTHKVEGSNGRMIAANAAIPTPKAINATIFGCGPCADNQ